ncbi:MAG TPA: flagellar protein FlgN [Clostridia bacterium]|nr:flagellar protein FlgN [Clostridia bacterium]
MSEFVDQLVMALEKEEEIYQDILDLSLKKKQAIIDGDVKNLEKIVNKEKALAMSLIKLDNIRVRIVNEILKENNVDSVENITELSEYINPMAKEKILKLKSKLNHVIKKVRNENELNKDLVEQQLDYIQFNIDLMTNVDLGSNNYSKEANDNVKKGRKNLFDAKI